MVRKPLYLALAAVAASGLLLAGCAKHRAVKRADRIADTGDWETALTQYRLAATEHPSDANIAERVKRAEKEVARIYVMRAADANTRGDMGEAGELWRRALEMSPDPEVQALVRDQIHGNSSALEYYGDISADFYSWEDALGAYGALLEVQPNSVELLEKFREAKRERAGDLTVVSDELERKNLQGAALVASLRALQLDPMQPGAFDRVTELRRELSGRTRVRVQEVQVEHKDKEKGYRTFGLSLIPKLTPRIDDFPPYGPTKDKNAVAADLVAVVEKLEREETVAKGEDVLANTIPPSKTPVPNPAIAEQEKVVAGLNEDLKELKSNLAKTRPGRVKKKGKRLSKKKLAALQAQARKEGLELARQVDAKRKEISKALADLKALPSTVPPPPPPETFTLPWKDVTRTVTARVRFELRESDFGEPVSVTIEKTLTKTDRMHKGHDEQGVFPDPLELPTFEALFQQLAGEFTDGAEVIARARERRVERVLAEGRNKKKMGEDEAALDAFVESLFLLGPDELPDDAAVEVAKGAENDRLKEILGVK